MVTEARVGPTLPIKSLLQNASNDICASVIQASATRLEKLSLLITTSGLC